MRAGDDIRGIKKTELFDEQLGDLIPDARRADEFVEAAEWTLSRNPWEGTRVGPASSVFFLPMEEVPDQPLVVLYYAFDARYVWFLCIEIV